MKGVVSARSFETLIQYLFTGNIKQKSDTTPEGIGHIIEFMRLADMCGVTGMEEIMAQRLKTIIRNHSSYYQLNGWCHSNPGPQNLASESHDKSLVVKIEHINGAAGLPCESLIRRVLAQTAVHDFFHCTRTQFWKDISREIPSFACDLMEASQEAMRTVGVWGGNAYFKDPIDGLQTSFGGPYSQGPTNGRISPRANGWSNSNNESVNWPHNQGPTDGRISPRASGWGNRNNNGSGWN